MQARQLLSLIISVLLVLAAAMTVSLPAIAQEATATVPRLITFSGTLGSAATDASESGVVIAPATAPTKVVAVTFSLYSEETGGAALWSEVQNVHVDAAGHYTVQLGASKPDGLPMDIFSSVQAHWLGVQPQGSAEQPRVLLVSVPYALKSADAETFGGLPPSAYVLSPSREASPSAGKGAAGVQSGGTSSSKPVVTPIYGNGAPGYIPLWSTFTTITSSAMYQNLGNGKIGIGTTTPNAKLDVNDNSSGSFALSGTTSNSAEVGTYGNNLAPSGNGVGTAGHALSPTGIGVFGFHDSKTGAGIGVSGLTSSSSGVGVLGVANTPTGSAFGVSGASASVDGVGVAGLVTSTGGQGHKSFGVEGTAQDPNGAGGTFANLAVAGPAVGVSAATNSIAGKGMYGVGISPSKTGPMFSSLTTMGVWGDSASGIGVFATSDDSQALYGVNNSSANSAVVGLNQATSGSSAYGVAGDTFSNGQNASGVYGQAMSSTGATNGVYGLTNSSDGNSDGVFGKATSSSGGANGVSGLTNSPSGYGVWGIADSTDPGGNSVGVYAQANTGQAIIGTSMASTGVLGVAGYSNAECCTNALFGRNVATSGHNNGGELTTSSAGGVGGIFENTGGGLSILARVNDSQNSFWVDGGGNGWFNGNLTVQGSGSTLGGGVQINGNLNVTGTLTKGGGSFKIDDPLDPANKYLSHSFVESPDMMNIYNGVVRLDARGEAWVVLPDYFEALNRDFRYQLTSLGSAQPRLYIAREVNGNRFKISGGRASGKVSWQVTGVRHDAWANAHRIPNEEDKPLEKRGTYLYPEASRDKSNENTSAMLQH